MTYMYAAPIHLELGETDRFVAILEDALRVH